MVKNLPANAGDTRDQVQFLGWEYPLEKEIAIYSSILAWETPWTEEPGGLHTPHGVTEADTIERLSKPTRVLNLITWISAYNM